jgi:hypothetical protein
VIITIYPATWKPTSFTCFNHPKEGWRTGWNNHRQAQGEEKIDVELGYEDLEQRLDQYWKYTGAAFAGVLLFQVYRQHLIDYGVGADTAMTVVVAVLAGLAFIGGKATYREYFEVSGQDVGSPEIE